MSPPILSPVFGQGELNQWRAYGRGEGGFSIGFDPAALCAKANTNTLIVPVSYDRNQQTALVQEMLSWALTEYSSNASKLADALRDEYRRNWGHLFLWRVAAIAPLMKNPDFSEEEEWRIIHLLQSKLDVKFVPKATELVPFVEMRFGSPQTGTPDQVRRLGRSLPGLLPITALWSGPGPAAETSLLAGRTLLEQYNYVQVPSWASGIPFRVG